MNQNHPNTKFTNQELIEIYNNGFGDCKMATSLGVHPSNVCRRRQRLGLIANRFPILTTVKELDEAVEQNRRTRKLIKIRRSDKIKQESKKAWAEYKKNPNSKPYWIYNDRIKNPNYRKAIKKAKEKFNAKKTAGKQ